VARGLIDGVVQCIKPSLGPGGIWGDGLLPRMCWLAWWWRAVALPGKAVRRQLEERQKVGFGAGASHWSWGIAFAGLARRSIPAQECQQDAFALSLGAGKIFNTSTS
jgi:hypothetical protein